MAFFPPVALIRRKHLISRLRACGAVSEDTAKTFAEAEIINPNAFHRITEVLIKSGVLAKTDDGKYYLR